jgi:hypothetical protein
MMSRRAALAFIYRCHQKNVGGCDGTGWHRITHHQTGIRWAEERQPKYATKAEAIAAVLAAEKEEDAPRCSP